MSAAELEAPRPPRAPGDTDAVTFSWADPDAELYGLAHLATGAGADGAPQASALAVAFAGGEPVGAFAGAAGAEADVEAPLERWAVRVEGEVEFALTFEALTPPATLGRRTAVAKAGGMEGYEQLCRVHGSVRAGSRRRPVNGLGQRGHAWGNPDWDRIALTRTVAAWLPDGTGYVLSAVRPARAETHADEALWAAALDRERVREVDEPRLSTTTDRDGRQIRAGLELWMEKSDDYPYRGTGDAVCCSTLDLGALRLQCAFYRWHVEGRTGVGRYDVIRRA